MSEAPRDAPTGEPVDVLDTGEAGGKVIRGGAFRVVSFGAGLLLSLASVPLMIRHLGVGDYGRFVTVSSIVFIIGGVTEAGLTNLGMREYATVTREERERLLRNIVGLRLTLTIGGVLIATALVAISGSDSVIVTGTLVAGIGLLITMVQQAYSVPISVSLRLGVWSLLELLNRAVYTALLIGLVIAGAGLLPFFWAQSVAGVLMLAVTLAVIRREVPWRPSFDRARWWSLLRLTLPYAAAAAVGIIYFRETIILMSGLTSAAQTGYYSAALKIVEIPGQIPWILVTSAFPVLARAARDDRDRFRYALQRLFETNLIIGVWLSLCTVVGARFAIDVVAGKGFGPAVPVLRIHALAIATTFVIATLAFALLSLHMHRALLVSNAIAVAVATVATLVLVPLFDARGAAVAPTAAELALALAYGTSLFRAHPELRLRFGIVPRVAVASAAGLACALIPLPAPAQVAIASAVFFGLLYALRGIPPEIFEALRLRRGARAS
jgi:O-antigen/teichoic acid export membrane protein